MVQINWLANTKNDLKDIYDYISLDSARYAKLQITKIQSSEFFKPVLILAKR